MLTGVNRLNEKLHLRYMCAALRAHTNMKLSMIHNLLIYVARDGAVKRRPLRQRAVAECRLSRSLSLTRSGSDKSPRNVMQSHKPINIEFWWVNWANEEALRTTHTNNKNSKFFSYRFCFFFVGFYAIGGQWNKNECEKNEAKPYHRQIKTNRLWHKLLKREQQKKNGQRSEQQGRCGGLCAVFNYLPLHTGRAKMKP